MRNHNPKNKDCPRTWCEEHNPGNVCDGENMLHSCRCEDEIGESSGGGFEVGLCVNCDQPLGTDGRCDQCDVPA